MAGQVSPNDSLRVLALGELLIDFTALDSDVDLGAARSFEKNPGGAPANVAVAVARLGGDAGFIGCVGDDAFGRYLLDVLRAERVDVADARAVADAATSLAFVARRGGEPDYFFVRSPGADTLFSPAMAEAVPLRRQDIIHFGSNSFAEQPIRSAAQRMLARADTVGAAVSFDVNLRPAFWGSIDEAHPICVELAQRADVLKVNRDELSWLTGADTVDEGLDRIAQLSAGLVCCTLGADGVALITPSAAGAGQQAAPGAGQQAAKGAGAKDPWEKDSGARGAAESARSDSGVASGHSDVQGEAPGTRAVLRVPGFRVAPVDATGAGDALIGALLYAIGAGDRGVQASGGDVVGFVADRDWKHKLAQASREKWREYARFACAAAACNIGHKGAISAMPTRPAVQEMLSAAR